MRFPDDVPTLTAGDVTLRAHRLDDVEAIVEQCTDPISQQWTTVPLDYTPEMAVDWVTNTIPQVWNDGIEQIFAIEATHPDGRRRFSGSLSLRDRDDDRAEIAFGAHPAVRARGVMTAAVNLLLDYGFGTRGYETVLWLANVGNFGSRRIAWKVGFTFGGVLPHWLPQRGDYLDGWVATLHKDDVRTPRTRWHSLGVIQGGSIRLRPLESRDVPRLVEACSDSRTQHWLAELPNPYTEDDATRYIAQSRSGAAEGTRMAWAVADTSTDELLACAGFPRNDQGSLEVGFWAHPDARGRGVATEAVSMLVRHAFVDESDGGLGARRLFLKSAAANTASQHVARSNGFVECGRERQCETLGDGTVSDLVVFDLLAGEWLSSAASGRQRNNVDEADGDPHEPGAS